VAPTSKWLLFPGLPKRSLIAWELITLSSDLGLRWGLKQTCSSSQELSNGVSHSIYTHRDWVDSWLFVVASQTASLTPGPSFAHNLCCRCPNGSCEAIFDIYTSKPFQRYKEHPKAWCFPSVVELWSCGSPGGLQVPTFGSVSLILTLTPKWGCDIVFYFSFILWYLANNGCLTI